MSVLPEDIVPWHGTRVSHSRRAPEALFGLVQEPKGRSEDRTYCVALEALRIGGWTPRHSGEVRTAEIRD